MSEFKERIIKLEQQRAEAESQRLLDARRVLTVAVELAALLSRNEIVKDIIFTERTLNEPFKRFRKPTYTDRDLVTGWLLQDVHKGKSPYENSQKHQGLILQAHGRLITYWARINDIDGGQIGNRIIRQSEGDMPSFAGYNIVGEEALRNPLAVEDLLVKYVVDREIDYSTL